MGYDDNSGGMLKSVARSLLPKKVYMYFRGKYLFNDGTVPTPLTPSKEFDPKWEEVSVLDKEKVERVHPEVVYVVSPTQRSGTNYINYLLNLHKDLEFPDREGLPKEQFLYSYVGSLKEYALKTVSAWGLWVEDDKVLRDHAKKMMSYLGKGLLNYVYTFITPGKKLLLKTPDSGCLTDFLHLFPNGKAVILVRDGRDTVESFIKSWGGKTIFKAMSQRWGQRSTQIEEFIRSAESSGNGKSFILVQYEKLNGNTREEMTRVLDFLGLDKTRYDWNGLENAPVLGSSTARGGQAGVNWNPVKKKEGFNKEPKWKKWGPGKKHTFKKYAQHGLEKLGYEKDADW